MKKVTVIFCICILFSGCTSAPKVDIQAEKDAIQSLEDQWSAALQAKDAEKILNFYAAEAVSMSSNKPIYTGLDAIKNGIVSMLADTTVIFNTYKGAVDAIELSATGDLAYARGHDEISKKTKEGIAKDEGKWVDIWKKFDGQWKVVVSISNSNNPLAGQ